MSTSVLYDAPGPKALLRYRMYGIATLVALVGVGWWIYSVLDEKGEWDADKWEVVTSAGAWENFFIPGLQAQLKIFAVASVLAIAFGLVFGVARMAENRAIRFVAGTVVEFFRAVPLLLLIFFIYSGSFALTGSSISAFWATAIGLVLYNGSVLAEVVRAGVRSLPKGQGEAGLSIGMRPQQVMNSILLPQGLRAMLPAVVAQLVVVMKDSALGYIIGYTELLRQGQTLGISGQALLQSMLVVAALFMIINLALGWLAVRVEKWMSRSKTTSGVVHVAPNMGEQGGGAV